ncbi:MAG TPA: asparagine synthase C-terminal domain-containing protein, partial [Candidatus Angelobacter sp.]|nr:asparagine synthase C-terminal domain-containing protein [Candidatus Angelobacter sp.]
DRYQRWISVVSPSALVELLSDPPPDVLESMERSYDRVAHLPALDRILYANFKTYLPDDLAVKMDRMSMANSLEVRAPFTDYRLLEFAMQVPGNMKIRRGITKWITRQALRNILPREVLEKKKMGFNPPLPQWINGELQPVIRQFLSPEAVERRGLFRPEAVQTLLRQHAENRRDNALKIWALLMIEVWQRMYFDKQSEESVLEEAVGMARRKPMVPAGPVAKKADVISIR